ncbi:hypothetical protein QEN19_002300 [Hanseniaspora menglaensis]
MPSNNDENDYISLPIDDQISSSLWKARVVGYEKLSKLLLENADQDELLNLYKKYNISSFISDTNVVSLEKGLQVINNFLFSYKADVVSFSTDILPNMINKAICSSTRKLTKQIGDEIVLKLVKLDKTVDSCFEITLINFEMLGNKKADKLVLGISSIILITLQNFQRLPSNNETLETLLSVLLILSQHSNVKIRKEAFQSIAILDFLITDKDILEDTVISKWKPIQLKEFNKHKEAWSQEKEKFVIQGFESNASPQAQMKSYMDDEKMEIEEKEEAKENREQELNVWKNKKSTKILSEEMIVESLFLSELLDADWKVRVDRLKQTIKLLEKIRKLDYMLEDYSNVFSGIAIRINKDTNLQVVQLSIELSIKMFRLIRDEKYIEKYAPNILKAMLLRLKDKKVCQLIKDVVVEITDLHPDNINCCLDLIMTKFLTHKVLQVRFESLNLLNTLLMKYYKSVNDIFSIEKIDHILPILIKFCSESQPKIREEGFKNLSILMKFVVDAEDEIIPQLERKLDSLKIKKVMQLKKEIMVDAPSSGKKRHASSPLKINGRSASDGVKLQKPSPVDDRSVVSILNNQPSIIEQIPKLNVADQKLIDENENLKFKLSKANNENLLLSKELEKIKKANESLLIDKSELQIQIEKLSEQNNEIKREKKRVFSEEQNQSNINYLKIRHLSSSDFSMPLSDYKRIESTSSIISTESLDEYYSKNIKQNDDLKEKVNKIREKIKNININGTR